MADGPLGLSAAAAADFAPVAASIGSDGGAALTLAGVSISFGGGGGGAAPMPSD